jgi:hypothetical protein
LPEQRASHTCPYFPPSAISRNSLPQRMPHAGPVSATVALCGAPDVDEDHRCRSVGRSDPGQR